MTHEIGASNHLGAGVRFRANLAMSTVNIEPRLGGKGDHTLVKFVRRPDEIKRQTRFVR
jgi:hypothetical protein